MNAHNSGETALEGASHAGALASEETDVEVAARSTPVDSPSSESVTPESRPWWLFAALALLSVAAAVMFVQGLTALELGTLHLYLYRWRFSIPVLLAVTVAIYIAAVCTSWADWRQRIGPCIIAATVVTAVATAVLPAPVPAAAVALPDAPTSAPISSWVRVDVPAVQVVQQVPTGLVLVDFSEVTICAKGQPWHDCVGELISNYLDVCHLDNISPATRGYRNTGWQASGLSACDERLKTIKQQQKRGGVGYTVATPGWSQIRAIPELKRETVTIEPAVTHIATCFFGIIGECQK